jgi:hypothetical protein
MQAQMGERLNWETGKGAKQKRTKREERSIQHALGETEAKQG